MRQFICIIVLSASIILSSQAPKLDPRVLSILSWSLALLNRKRF